MTANIRNWLPYIDLSLTSLAVGIWMFRPESGAWPLILGLAPWLLRRSLTGKWGLRNPFTPPMALFLLSAGIGVWAAYDREAALAKFWLIVGAILLSFTFVNWTTAKGRRAVQPQLWILTGLGSLMAIHTILTYGLDTLPVIERSIAGIGDLFGRISPLSFGERINPNISATVMVMMLPFNGMLISDAFENRNRRDLIAGLSLISIIIMGVILSGSRGAWFAVALVGSAYGLWHLARVPVRKSRFKTIAQIAILAVGGLVVVAILFSGSLSNILLRWQEQESVIRRVSIYRDSLVLVRDYFFSGSGLGNFMMLYSSYALLLHVGFLTHAHNLYLDLVIEQGILALVALTWMLWLVARAFWRVWQTANLRQPLSTKGSLFGAGVASLLIMLLHGTIDDTIYSGRTVVIFFIPFALAAAKVDPVSPIRTLYQTRTILALAGVAFLVLLVAYRPIVGQFKANLAAVSQSKLELEKYKFREHSIQDAVRVQVDIDPVVDAYRDALEIDRTNTTANRRLGQLLLSLGEYQEARQRLELAYSQTPWENPTRILLGEAYIVDGQRRSGLAMWERADLRSNQLAVRESWYRMTGEDAKLEAIRTAREELS